VSDAEPALGLGEVAQRFLIGRVSLLGKRLEEIDHLDRRIVVGGGLHEFVAGGGIVDRLEVRCGATGGVLSNASGHVRSLRMHSHPGHAGRTASAWWRRVTARPPSRSSAGW